MQVAIIGAGIAGLALALNLHGRGVSCRIYEQAPELKEIGVGITLLPHAVRELSALGLQPQLEADGVENSESRFFNRFGQLIFSEPRGRGAGYPVPELGIHRGRLHGIMFRAVRERLRRVRHFSGATLLPSGRIALILNAADLLRSALQRAPGKQLAVELTAPMAEPKLLLVVDDSVTTRSLVKSILEAAGYTVLTAPDGIAAWQILQERGADLVVADVEMPRMDGCDLAATIRKSPRFRKLPVVLVTALDSVQDRTRGMEAGADAYLIKSAFDQKELLETIAQLV